MRPRAIILAAGAGKLAGVEFRDYLPTRERRAAAPVALAANARKRALVGYARARAAAPAVPAADRGRLARSGKNIRAASHD